MIEIETPEPTEAWDPDADLDELQAQPFDPDYLED